MTEEHEPNKKSGGILGDLKSIKSNGMASLKELREFIGSLKGRKPKEFMGEVANNGLVQGIVISTVGFLVILVAFTAIPFYMTEKEPVVQKKKPAESSSPKDTETKKTPPAKEKEKAAKSEKSDGKTGDKVLDNLGIGQTKKADPNENPLGDKFKDLLKDVK